MTTLSLPAVSFHELLVASDLSPASEKALGYAKAIAMRHGSHILVLHVSKPIARIAIPEGGWVEDDSWQLIEAEVEAEGLALRAEGFHGEAITVHGPVEEEVRLIAEAHHSDLMILGSHGREGLARFVIGSKSEALIRHAICPVLTIGPAAPVALAGEWLPKNILCGISLDDHSAQVAAYGYSLATQFGAKFTLLHVHDMAKPPDADSFIRFEQEFEASLPRGTMVKPSVHSLLYGSTAGTSLADVAKERGADLILLGVGHANVVSEHLGRGILPAVLADAPCPVMTVRAGAGRIAERSPEFVIGD